MQRSYSSPGSRVDSMSGSPDSRAIELLQRVLPETQWAQFCETGILEVSGSQGTYRICARDQTRVLNSQTGRPVASACLQLSVPAPFHDRLIAEYMLIRNDEDLYWRTANIFPATLDGLSLGFFLAVIVDVLLFAIFIVRLGG